MKYLKICCKQCLDCLLVTCVLYCESGETLGVPIHVFGPETHMTSIVGMALGKKAIHQPVKQQSTTANFLLPGAQVSLKQVGLVSLFQKDSSYCENWSTAEMICMCSY